MSGADESANISRSVGRESSERRCPLLRLHCLRRNRRPRRWHLPASRRIVRLGCESAPPIRAGLFIGMLGSPNMTDVPYIRDEDKREYQKFSVHHLGSFGRSPVEEVWHYTNAEGLIGILKAGKIFA